MAGVHHDLARIARARGLELLVDEPQPWLTRNGHLHELVQVTAPDDVLAALAAIFAALGGDARQLARNKGGTPSAPDLVHVASGRVVELDELPHFGSSRERTFEHYPAGTPLGFDTGEYRSLIRRHREAADAVLAREQTKDFPFPGGRQAQRAYGDALRDLLAPVFTGHAVVRLAVPDGSLTGVVQQLEARLGLLGGAGG